MPAKIPAMRPISDLRTKLGEIEMLAKTTGEPIVLTRNGTASLVVLDSDAFNKHIEEQRHIRKLREAEIEKRYLGETVSLKDSRSRIDRLFHDAAELGLIHG